jgi:hypothetical protein
MIRAIQRWIIDCEDGCLRTRSFEFSFHAHRWAELSLNVIKFEEKWSLNIGLLGCALYLNLPFEVKEEPEDMLDKWGVSWFRDVGSFPDLLVLEWGPGKRKSIPMPWQWSHHKSEVLLPDGSFGIRSYDWKEDRPDGRKIENFPYRYVCNDGEVQDVTAKVFVSRMEWRWTGLKGLPYPRKVQTCIDVEFDNSVGEGRGSWKGGCTGCGIEMLPSETPEQTLRRMEKTRRFER